MNALREVWAGFSRPFTLLAGLRRAQPAEWNRFRRVIAAQALAVLVLAALIVSLGDAPVSKRRTLERRGADAELSVELDSDEPRAPFGLTSLRDAFAWLALGFSALVMAQWATLALTREFQAPIGRALEAVAGLDGDEPAPPRVRVDVKWLRKKLGQKVRGVLVLLPGFVAFTPVFLATKVLGLDDFVMPPLMFGWSAYWWCTFTVGRSGLAWEDEASGAQPHPLRWWLARTERTPGFRWFGPRWVGAFAKWAMKRDLAPAVAFERAPLYFVGVGLARFVTSPPLVRLAFREAVDAAVSERVHLQRERGTLPAPAAVDGVALRSDAPGG
ncbi:MAG: hypothetical protein ACOZQL_42610 [Myxococcota bacterium]